MTEKPAIKIAIDPASKRELKALGGGDRDQWNERLLNLVTRALPVSQEKIEAVSHVGSAVMAGVVDMNPTDPIEGVLNSQLVVANERRYRCIGVHGPATQLIISMHMQNICSSLTKPHEQ
jgi:hypothetical protein